MAEGSFEEKTEQATPKKRQDARKKGQVAKSREVPSMAVLLAAVSSMAVFGSYMTHHLRLTMQSTWASLTLTDITVPQFLTMAQQIIFSFLLILAPMLAVIFLTALLSNVLQVGFLLSTEAIRPKFSKISPLKGFTRLFSKQSVMELIKSLLKLALVGSVAYLSIRAEFKSLHFLGNMELNDIVAYTLATTFKIFIRITLAMILLVVIDFAFQRWDFQNQLKMTKQEVKDEMKSTEGDPQVKARIRGIQMQMARKRMMQEVPKADVVITNPTHFAVAIKYDGGQMGAPRVLAKGAGEVALKIKALAAKNNIPVVENKELARNLYAMVELGAEIPASLYQAVAEVLAYIYGLKGTTARAAG